MNFTTIAQIEAAPTKDLIAFYNEINADKPVKKFADRATALKRCIALLGDATEEVETKEVEENLKETQEESTNANKPAFPWPFAAKGDKELSEEEIEEASKSLVDSSPDFAALNANANAKAAKAKKPLSTASNAAGVAASWADPSVAAARMIRDGVSVTAKGQTTTHKSTREAFRFYRLLDSKHIRFRGVLKASKKATYNENGVDYLFEII